MKNEKQLFFVGLIIALVLLFPVNILEGNSPQKSFSIQYQVHDPIDINGNDDFMAQAIAEGWEGDGTSSSPYIIEGYEIKSTPSLVYYGDGLIEIENTDVYFQISNCRIEGEGPYQSGSDHNYNGIRLYKIKNGHISNNIIFNNGMHGIALARSETTTISSNTIYQNSGHGINLFETDDSSIMSNTVYNNDRNGIRLEDSNNNEVIGNNAYNNGLAGILMLGQTEDIFIDGTGNITETSNNATSPPEAKNTSFQLVFVFLSLLIISLKKRQ